MKTTSNNKDVYQIINDLILDKLSKGSLPWRQTWSSFGAARNYVSKKAYRGFNALLLNMLHYDYPLFMTFHQAKQLGGHIKKGSKSIPVIYWKMLHFSADGKAITSQQAQKQKGSKKVPLLRYYLVFNIQDIEGIEFQLPDRNIPNNPIEGCEKIVSEMPLRPEIRHGGDEAFYHPTEDYVKVPHSHNFNTSETYYATLFHELSHSTGHAKRLNRPGITEKNHFGSKDYSIEELIAEISTCFLCNHAGINQTTLDNSVAYLENWMGTLTRKFKEDKTCFVKASAKAQQAADYILNHTTEKEEDTAAPETQENTLHLQGV